MLSVRISDKKGVIREPVLVSELPTSVIKHASGCQ